MGWSCVAACAIRSGSRSPSAFAWLNEARTRMRLRSEVARSLPSAALPKRTTEMRSEPKASLADCKNEFRISAMGAGSWGNESGVEEVMEDPARHERTAVLMLGCLSQKVNEAHRRKRTDGTDGIQVRRNSGEGALRTGNHLICAQTLENFRELI